MADEKAPKNTNSVEKTAPSSDKTASAVQPALTSPSSKEKAKAATVAIRHFFARARKGSIWTELPEMFSSLFSSDSPTRRMSVLFLLSLIGATWIVGSTLHRYWMAKKVISQAQEEKKAKQLEAKLRKEAEENKRLGNSVTLGSFTLELKEVTKERLGSGEINMAEMEIVLLCNDQEARNYLQENSVQVRNQLTNVLTAIDREELLSRDGKRKLKVMMIRKLNDWLPQGKVEDVYFSKLIIK